MNKSPNENKLLGLELIRFLASLAVLIYHYQHFINNIALTSKIVDVNQPFYTILSPFYTFGYYGVHLFWCLSGYIFFWKYSYVISSKLISSKKFAILRFSRLYPLHFATLILAAGLQLIYFSIKGEYFIFQSNTPLNFILQLFMASNWWIKDLSFNVPIWSVSIEIVVYFLFFIIVRFLGAPIITVVAIITSAFLAYYFLGSNSIFLSLLLFFLGGFVEIIQKLFKSFSLLFSLSSLIMILMGLIISIKFQKDWLSALIIIPSIIFLLSEHVKNVPAFMSKTVIALGNMTYSTYLIHFPIQLIIVLFFAFIGQKVPYYNPLFFLFFIFITLVVARCIFVKFEVPMQKKMRTYFLS